MCHHLKKGLDIPLGRNRIQTFPQGWLVQKCHSQLQLHWDGVRFSVLMVQFQGFPRLCCRVLAKRGGFALPEKALKHHHSDWFSSRLVIFITGVSLPQWVWFWRAFRNTTLWMFSLLLISFALGPQSPCSRNLRALLSIFVINPRLRETWGLVDCWTPYVSGAMLKFPCYKQWRKSQNLLRIWLRPLNILISTDQRSLQSSNSTSLNKYSLLHPKVALRLPRQ